MVRIWTERPWFAVMLDEINLTIEKLGMNRNLAKNDHAGEGQQQFTGLDWTGRYVEVRIQYLSNFPSGLILLIVGIATGCGLDGRGSIAGSDKRFCSALQCPDRLWGPRSLLSRGYRGLFL
jgi:hypothetical protein